MAGEKGPSVYNLVAGETSFLCDNTGRLVPPGAISAEGQIDGQSLGATIPYVTVQSGAPSTYQTPLVYDTTAVTGGCWAWDGSAYQQISNVVA